MPRRRCVARALVTSLTLALGACRAQPWNEGEAWAQAEAAPRPGPESTAKPIASPPQPAAHAPAGSASRPKANGEGSRGSRSLPAQAVPPIRLAPQADHGLPGLYQGGLAPFDFDADGRLDLVLAGYFAPGRDARQNCLSTIEAHVYRNVSKPGAVRFERVLREKELGACGAQVVTGDFDGDGRADFALQVKNGIDTTVYLGRGSGRFSPTVVEKNFGTHSTSHGFAAADVDRDGITDLIFASDGSADYYKAGRGLWYRWNGRAFRPQQEDFPHAISYGGTLAAGDLDGDGYPELAVAGNASQSFGAHRCENLLYGQIHRNVRGRFDPKPMAVVANFALRAFGRASPLEPPNPRRLEETCAGGDNVQYAISDVDRDGHLDLIVAGSGGFGGRPEMPGGAHYGFAILRNADGTGQNFVTWENEGIGRDGGPGHLDGNSTNTGVGNVDLNGIAVGDLNGDGWPEVLIQGHRRELERDEGRYVYGVMLFANLREGQFRWVPNVLELERPLGGGGNVIADFDGDGRNDVIIAGAERAFHTAGTNPEDRNTTDTIRTVVFRGIAE